MNEMKGIQTRLSWNVDMFDNINQRLDKLEKESAAVGALRADIDVIVQSLLKILNTYRNKPVVLTIETIAPDETALYFVETLIPNVKTWPSVRN